MKKILYSLILVCVCAVSQAQTNWQIEKGSVMDSLFQQLAGKIYIGETSNKIFWQGWTQCTDKSIGEKCMMTIPIVVGSQKIRGTLTYLLTTSDQIIRKWCKPDDNGEIRGHLGFVSTDTIDVVNSDNLNANQHSKKYRLHIGMWEQPQIAPGKITVRLVISRSRFAEEVWTLFWDRNMSTNIVQKLELSSLDGTTTVFEYNELSKKTTKTILKKGK